MALHYYLLLIAVAIASIALCVVIIIIMQQRRRQWKEEKEELAAKYNPYRRTNTLGKQSHTKNNNKHRVGKNSTGGSRRERRRLYQQKQGKDCYYNDASNNNDDNFSFLLRLSVFYKFIISAFQQVLSFFRSCTSCTPFGYVVTSKTDNVVSQSQSSYSHDRRGGANSLHEYYSNTIVIGLDCEMVGAGRGGKDSMLARCSLVTLDYVPNEHVVDDDDGDDDDNNNIKNVVVEEKVSTSTSVQVDEGGLTTTTTTFDTADVTNDDDHSSNDELPFSLEKQHHRKTAPTGPLDTNLIILYDKYVIPRRKVTDYRTEWSGITKETYAKRPSQCQSSLTSYDNGTATSIPIVSFETCKHEISKLFASINGKNVIVVGHGLVNDFDVLEIHHPVSNIRDTSTYKPYQRETRKKLYPRKLSTLACEELGIHIQQQQQTTIVGHSSVEDAAAALRLYWHKHGEWERSLGYPLLRRRHDNLDTRRQQQQQRRIPLKMYLDGCNLPISCRGVNFNDLIGNTTTVNDNNDDVDDASININNHDGRDTIILVPSDDFQIISRMRQQQQYNGGGYQTSNNTNPTAIIDWMPIFKCTLSSPPQSTILDSITIMFDGAKYENLKKCNRNNSTPISSSGSSSIREELGSAKTYKFRIDSSLSSSSLHSSGSCDNNGSIMIEITDCGDSTDDVLVYTTSLCKSATNDGGKGSSNSITTFDAERKIISLEEVIDILSHCTDNDADILSHYIVIRRKAGGTKTHRQLFDKLHLRRPNEGAICLSSLTMGLHKNSLSIARELRREKSINSVIECELRNRDELRYIVVTNDVYLTDRLVRENRVLVLSYNQFTNMW